jgi:GntR family transcriptional regulator
MTDFADPELTLVGGIAICRQICTQIRDFIVQGRLQPGEELPSIRAMAVELAVNPEVVERAYAELEREGIVTSSEGSGVFVSTAPCAQAESAACAATFEELCSEFLAQAARYGFSSEDIIERIRILGNKPLSR